MRICCVRTYADYWPSCEYKDIGSIINEVAASASHGKRSVAVTAWVGESEIKVTNKLN